MVVGVMELHFALIDNDSLKQKRSVVKRIVHRCRNNFNVSVAEVEDQDFTDRATIGVVAVGNDARYIGGLLDKLEGFVDRLALAELLDAPKTIERY
ncbi:MAG: hypothetical protein A2289_10605 [Deltaproteobacteria bacterium RIFOXYA12_FULL_58_15]|nr:MAG: hypothetical protein A2289_10605 [Deltaproteobacteria bacterium RIFOXYA12_FULL_58_15]OGR12428.1 MAG: hypothetical protein A2341_19905 [Deltaproteobacteria bacterium RIFOXYB12_FULL_58_9]